MRDAEQSEPGRHVHNDHSFTIRTIAYCGGSIEVLSNQSRLRGKFEASSKRIELRVPGRLAPVGGGHVAAVVVAKCAQHVACRPFHFRARVVTGAMIDFVEELDILNCRIPHERARQMTEQCTLSIVNGPASLKNQNTGRIIPAIHGSENVDVKRTS